MSIEQRCPLWVIRYRAIQPRCRPMSAMHPEATKILQRRDWSLCQNASQQKQGYSITSSTRASTDGGTVRLSALAVLRLSTVSYLVGAAHACRSLAEQRHGAAHHLFLRWLGGEYNSRHGRDIREVVMRYLTIVAVLCLCGTSQKLRPFFRPRCPLSIQTRSRTKPASVLVSIST